MSVFRLLSMLVNIVMYFLYVYSHPICDQTSLESFKTFAQILVDLILIVDVLIYICNYKFNIWCAIICISLSEAVYGTVLILFMSHFTFFHLVCYKNFGYKVVLSIFKCV